VIKLKVHTSIRRPVAEVFAFVTDVANFPRWSGDLVKESRQTSPGPIGQGATFAQTNQFLGRPFATQFEVIEYEPDRKFCVQNTVRGFVFVGCYLFEEEAGGTRLTNAAELDVSGFFSLMGAMLIQQIRRQTETNLANLKALLESGAAD
jgi:uncharacterized protein YndB with AHSA1/START domain